MDTLDEALRARIDELAGRTRAGNRFCPRRDPGCDRGAHSTDDRLERAVGELSLKIEALASQRGGPATHVAAGSDR